MTKKASEPNGAAVTSPKSASGKQSSGPGPGGARALNRGSVEECNRMQVNTAHRRRGCVGRRRERCCRRCRPGRPPASDSRRRQPSRTTERWTVPTQPIQKTPISAAAAGASRGSAEATESCRAAPKPGQGLTAGPKLSSRFVPLLTA